MDECEKFDKDTTTLFHDDSVVNNIVKSNAYDNQFYVIINDEK